MSESEEVARALLKRYRVIAHGMTEAEKVEAFIENRWRFGCHLYPMQEPCIVITPVDEPPTGNAPADPIG